MYSFSKIIWLKKYISAIVKMKHGLHLDYPDKIWIEITNECNLRCIMCPQSKGLRREKKTMDTRVFMRVINQVCRGRPLIILHVSGEPLLHKNLFEMIEYAQKKGCLVAIHTNATLLTQEMALRILQSSLDSISFSFDGCTPEIYEKLRVGAKFEQVKSQIEAFLKLRHEMKLRTPAVRIEILYMKETKEYVRDFIRYWRYRGADRVGVRECVTWLGLTDDHRVKVPKNFGHVACAHVLNECSILADGTIVPCCLDMEGRLPLGNILETNFKEIWNGRLYNRLRIQHINNNVQEDTICHECHLRRVHTARDFIKRAILEVC